MRMNFDFGYLGDYFYKGWEISIYRNLDGTYNGRSQGYSCYTKSQRSIKLKRKFRLWVNSLPEEAFIAKEKFIKSGRYRDYSRGDMVGRGKIITRFKKNFLKFYPDTIFS